ncbi:SGNH/GDSL hydrolase family protein [uncultured Tateyamaria sp.]|uniref:SGNH/GDSL hydrolase family protein n=1 Tax=Tateyamaria sp. 1078 TaxID=3417464 RepID=UPI002601DAEE|nr:SGNH/GDSL hydrolase family protein [uncultured Tateyamaria sp.]
MRRVICALAALFFLVGCVEPVPSGGQARIMAMGDSLLAWNAGSGRAVSDALEARLGQPVVDRSVPGASYLYPLPISGSLGLRIERQFVAGDWDWIVLNGGGNDLWRGCGCGKCRGQLERLISADGTSGAIPTLIGRIRAKGTRVAYVGYLRTPGFRSPVEGCVAIGSALEARIAALAARDPGVVFVSNSDLVPNGDRSFHDSDLLHPSPKGSAAIAARLAALMQ